MSTQVSSFYRNALASSSAESLEAILDLIDGLANDPDYRKRMVALAAVLAIVKTPGFERSVFDTRLLPSVPRLASDKVAGVRIGVARLVAELGTPSDR